MRPEDILMPTPSGVCCKRGGFYIDPTRPVEKALITHGHSDHARAGHGAVLATQETLDLMRLRYGENFAGTAQAVGYGETVSLGGARVTFHPAGHVLGSAQIAVEANGLRIVAAGDYKDVAELDLLAIMNGLRRLGEILAIAQPHQVERFLRGEHRAVAGPRMVGVPMRDQRLLDGARRVDVETAALAAHAGRRRNQDVFGADRWTHGTFT